MARQSTNADTLTFAIGDVHGCSSALRRMFAACEDYANGRPSRFVFIGDYIDRGPDSAGVIAMVRARAETDPENVVCLIGNHEDLLLEALRTGDEAHWLHNGGDATLESYGVRATKDLPDFDRAFIKSLKLSHDDGQRLFVHAGIMPGIPLEDQDRDTLVDQGAVSLLENGSRAIDRAWPHAARFGPAGSPSKPDQSRHGLRLWGRAHGCGFL